MQLQYIIINVILFNSFACLWEIGLTRLTWIFLINNLMHTYSIWLVVCLPFHCYFALNLYLFTFLHLLNWDHEASHRFDYWLQSTLGFLLFGATTFVNKLSTKNWWRFMGEFCGFFFLFFFFVLKIMDCKQWVAVTVAQVAFFTEHRFRVFVLRSIKCIVFSKSPFTFLYVSIFE